MESDTTTLSLRVTPLERHLLVEAARRRGVNLSALLRTAALEVARETLSDHADTAGILGRSTEHITETVTPPAADP